MEVARFRTKEMASVPWLDQEGRLNTPAYVHALRQAPQARATYEDVVELLRRYDDHFERLQQENRDLRLKLACYESMPTQPESVPPEVRVAVCQRCGQTFTPKRRGKPAKRCDACKVIHRRQVSRVAYRHGEAMAEAAGETYRCPSCRRDVPLGFHLCRAEDAASHE